MSGHVNEGDEDAFVENAENFVMNLQRMGRTKLALQYLPVIEACMKLEDMAYMEAMREKHLPSSAQLWSDRGAIDVYMDICDTMTRNLGDLVRKDWPSKFNENPPIALFKILSGRQTVSFGPKRGIEAGEHRGGKDKKRRSSTGAKGNQGKKGQAGAGAGGTSGLPPAGPSAGASMSFGGMEVGRATIDGNN